jgi:hypothetical protein
MEVDLLVHPVGHRMPVQVMLEQRQRHDQRQQALPVVLDEAQQLQPALGRRCPHWTGDSSGGPSGAGSLSAWIRWLENVAMVNAFAEVRLVRVVRHQGARIGRSLDVGNRQIHGAAQACSRWCMSPGAAGQAWIYASP